VEDGVTYDQFKPVLDIITVNAHMSSIHSILNVQFDEEGKLLRPEFKEKAKGVAFLRWVL